MAETPLHFSVDPSVVYQLGESLITDAMVAIIELVKNSYDADASYSKVVIDTQGVTKPDDSFFDEEGGIITIEDDGCGMNLDEIRNGWLTISGRHKLKMKRQNKITKRGRSPLGDKGLGRLGVQKLGKNVEIYTQKEGGKGYHLGFSWLEFISAKKIENVKIIIDEIVFPKPAGTKIVISGLMEPELWEAEKKMVSKGTKNKKGKNIRKQNSVIDRLRKELSRLVSPYKEIRDFTVFIEKDGIPIDLTEISDSIRNNALLRYKIKFDGKKLLISGKAKLNYFLPTNKDDLLTFQKIVNRDNGEKFYNFLETQNLIQKFKCNRARTNNWFIDFEYKRNFADMDKVEFLSDGLIANPGSFFGEIDVFNFNILDSEQHLFDQKSEYRQLLKDNSGIRVFRDGFSIRVDQDWLGLGQQQTIGGSFYGLRPLNTLGFISLTAQENINLEETTDREGFKDTSFYRNFFLLLAEFVKFSSDIQEDLRRACNEFRKKYQETSAGIDTNETTENITKQLEKKLAEANNYQKNIILLKDKISKKKSSAINIIDALAENKNISKELQCRAIDILRQFKQLMDETDNTLNRMDEYILELSSLKDHPVIIKERIKDLHKQIEIMYETVALGLAAEVLAHEISNVTDQLAMRAKAIKTYLAKQKITDKDVLIFIEYVNSAISALQKQMTFLSPALRYVRERRIIIDMEDFINEIKVYFTEKWEKCPISINVLLDVPFSVKINKGKLIQIIDNLILNSEYWLKEDIKQGKIKKGIVYLHVSSPYITIFDNGRGIDPIVEFSLFEPFITTKVSGRGLGLFIVKQLLDSEGCNIELLLEKNNKKHYYKFRLNFGEVIND